MFPGAGAVIYRNEAGEPLGWDYPSYDEGDSNDPYDYDDRHGRADAAAEARYEEIVSLDDDDLLELHQHAEGWELDSVHDQLGDRGITDPCRADDAHERANPLLAEVRRAELWGGTE